MTRGRPDYDNPDYQVAIEQNDLSIISIVNSGFTFMDGKGRIVWYDNISQGLAKWNPIGFGGGLTPYHMLSNSFSYGYHGCFTLFPQVDMGSSAIYADQNISFGKRVGLEVYVLLESNHGRFTVTLQQSPEDGTLYTAVLYVEEGTGDIYITTPSGDVKIYDMPNHAYIYLHWTNIKLVGDYSTGKFYRCVIGGKSFDLSAYDMVTTSFGIKGKVSITLTALGKPAPDFGQVYIGGVLVSVDEP